MDNLNHGALKIDSIQENGTTTLFFKGRSEERNPSELLTPYFKKVAEEINGELKVDFTSFEYMNSSTVSPLLMFIKDLNMKGVTTNLIYNKSLKWQAASFKALETISTTLDHVSVIGQ